MAAPVDIEVAVTLVRAIAGRPCTPAHIRVWAHRGHLTRHGYDRQKRSRYDVDELEALAHAWRDGTPLPRPRPGLVAQAADLV